MARVLFWNVDNFNADKFFLGVRERAGADEEEWDVNPSAQKRGLLMDNISSHDPDFIIIVEVGTGSATAGAPAADQGTFLLLQALRASKPLQAWALVPPIVSGILGKSEGVAIYYRSDVYHFTGPCRWPGGNGPAAAPPAALGCYLAPWCSYDVFGNPILADPVNALPNRNLPAGTPYNGGQPEYQLAPETVYTHLGAVINFGLVGGRTPYAATFSPVAAPGTTLRIVGYHAPPEQQPGAPFGDSVRGTQAMANLRMIHNPPANETVLIVGDFNVSLFDAATSAAAYGPLLGLANPYQQVIGPLAGFVNEWPSKGYLITHVKSTAKATPVEDNGYPMFGYGSTTDRFGTYDSIDNAFVRYPGAGAPSNATIVNRVVTTPYNDMPGGAPPGVPKGQYVYITALNDDVSLNSPLGRHPDDIDYDDQLEIFRRLDNYGNIRNVSDHLALLFDI